MNKIDIVTRNIFYQNKGILGIFRILDYCGRIDFFFQNINFVKEKIDWLLVSDTNASMIKKRMEFLKSTSSKNVKIFFLDQGISRSFYFFIKSIYFYKFLFYLIISKESFSNNVLLYFSNKYNFKNVRFLVFYEKSFLSMVIYSVSPAFEVLQHGNITETFFPSLADKYYFWNDSYKRKYEQFIPGISLVSGYPQYDFGSNLSNSTFHFIFFSQVGNNPNLKKIMILVREWVKKSSLKFNVAVKLHPSESRLSWSSGEHKIVFLPNEFNFNSIHQNTICCSFYSTVLIELLMIGKKVSRLGFKKVSYEDPFPVDIYPIPVFYLEDEITDFFDKFAELSYLHKISPVMNLDFIK